MEQTLLVYSHHQTDVEWLQSMLAPQQVQEVGEPLSDLLGMIDVTGAHLVFVGLDSEHMMAQCGVIEGLLEARPFVTVIGLADGLDNQLVINAMRAGARDFIVYSMRGSEIQGVVRRLSQRLPMLPVKKQQGELSLIYGAQPDTDAALVALHMALHAQQHGGQILLLDLGCPHGESLEITGLKSSFYFGDALSNLRRLDANLIDSAFSQHDSGLNILAYNGHDGPLSDIYSTELYLLLGILRQNFTHIIVNLCGQPDSEPVRTFVGNSQKLYWYVDQSVSCCQRSLAIWHEWQQQGIKLDHCRLVVDRYIANTAPDANSLADLFKMPLAASLPLSPAVRLAGKNQGRSLFQASPRDPLSRALGRLSASVIETTNEGRISGWLKRWKVAR